MRNFKSIIFDLDGTLLDSSLGIFNSVRYAEKMMGLEKISDSRLKEFVGPPPKKMYAKVYNLSEEKALKCAGYHREYSKNYGAYESNKYEGLVTLLETLQGKNYKLSVATLKSQKIAENVLEYHGIKKYFDAIIGMDDKESLTKARTIELAMESVGVLEKEKTLMVGDSLYDLDGAKECGIKFVAALYGFGFDKEVQDENVYACINKISELLQILS